MRVLVAPNAFKGTLTAAEAAAVIADAIRRVSAQPVEVALAPMADGGDGTLDAFLAAGYSPAEVPVHDAAGRASATLVAHRDGDAVIELARTCGAVTVHDLPHDPWRASSLGFGEAARTAIDAGATRIALAVGGSASVDGGVGFLQGLGFVVADVNGDLVTPDAAGMARAHSIAGVAPTGIDWTVLADVDNPLLGPDGALMFAAQKGIPESEMDVLHRAWAHWADVLRRATGTDVAEVPHGGAAGGVAAAAHAVLGARLTSGARAIATMLDLPRRIADADLVITGEGRFDDQSLHGKATGVVVELARAHDKTVAVLAGEVTVTLPGVVAIETAAAPNAGHDRRADLGWAAARLVGPHAPPAG